MREINNGMTNSVAPEMGRQTVNGKLTHTGGLTKREIESLTGKVGQMEGWKKVSSRPVR